MTLIIAIDIIVVGALVGIALTKGFEDALPLTAFLLMLFPNESQIHLPGLFDLTSQRLLIVVLVVLYVVIGKPQKRLLPLKYLALLLMAWMLLSSANSVVPAVSFKTTLSQFFDFFVLYYIYAKTISKTETVHKILFAFVAAMFVCSIFGFFERYNGWSVISLFPPLSSRFANLAGMSDRGIRVQSTFGHPILFGAALAMAIPMGLYLLTVVATTARKVFLWAAILLMFQNIYQTGSRGPWMAVALSAALLLALGRGALRKYLTIIALLTVTVLVARPGVWDTIRDLYGETLSPDTPQGESYEWRYVLFSIAQRELSKDFGRSLWGYGPESFYYLGLTTQAQVDGEEHTVKVESCDSAVVEIMMDTGYIGFLLVAALLLKAAFVTFRNFLKMARPSNSVCLVFFVNLCAFCFLMTNVELWGWGQQSYMLWILIALIMVYPRLQADDRAADDSAQTVPQLVEAMAS
jgi:hypothetical protein